MRRILPRFKIIKTSPYPWICALQLHVNVGMCMCLEYCEDHWEIFLSNLVRVENIRNCIYFIGLVQGHCTIINIQNVSEPELASEASFHPLSPARYSKGMCLER